MGKERLRGREREGRKGEGGGQRERTGQRGWEREGGERGGWQRERKGERGGTGERGVRERVHRERKGKREWEREGVI